jgi:hypothetical protein
MTATHTHPAEHATAPGSAADYDIAVALAVAAERLADAVDDNRPDWLGIARNVGGLLADLVTARLGVPLADGVSDAALADDAAELSATAADLATDLTEGRFCPARLTRARHLLDALASALGSPADTAPAPAA